MSSRTVPGVLRGAAAGAAATVPMSAAMLAAKKLGLMGKQPPEAITEAALSQLGIEIPERAEKILSSLDHLGFGAAAGALYAVLRRALSPRVPGGVAGSAFGLLVWFVSYQGWVPRLRILPPVNRDRPGRPQSMALAHVVYGSVLDRLLRR